MLGVGYAVLVLISSWVLRARCGAPNHMPNVSIVLQPPIFDLDSGKELRHLRSVHIQPLKSFLVENKNELGRQGIYVNDKLNRAHILSQFDQREVYSLAASDQNSTEYGFAIRKEPPIVRAQEVTIDLGSFSRPF